MNMEKENKERLVKILVSAVLLATAMLISKTAHLKLWQELLMFLVPYLIVGWETLVEAAEKLIHGELLDEDFLMSIATLGALSIGFLPGADSQFPEAVFVMLFFQVGEFFEEMAEDRSRDSISALMDIRPDTANVERDGEIVTLSPSEVGIGEVIVVKPGEKVPMDGTVLEGNSSLDTVALTGESMPRGITPGDELLSGCVNLTGVIRAKVTRSFGESTATKIINLVESASSNKSRSESFISRFAKVYTPIVVAAAVVLAFVMVSIKTEERVPVSQQYAKTISTPPPDSRRPEPNGQPHDDKGTTGQASLPETTTAPQEPKLLANNTETPESTGKTDEEPKLETRLSVHLPTETVTEARRRAATSQPMYVGYPSNVTAANYSSQQGGESHYVPSGNASFVTRIMVNGNEATYFMSSGNSLKILHNEERDDSVVYKVDGEWVDKEAVEQLSPDSITELRMLERGSAAAIKESKKGRTNDILLITTKRQRAQRQDHSSVPARKSLQISDYDKRNGLYLL